MVVWVLTVLLISPFDQHFETLFARLSQWRQIPRRRSPRWWKSWLPSSRRDTLLGNHGGGFSDRKGRDSGCYRIDFGRFWCVKANLDFSLLKLGLSRTLRRCGGHWVRPGLKPLHISDDFFRIDLDDAGPSLIGYRTTLRMGSSMSERFWRHQHVTLVRPSSQRTSSDPLHSSSPWFARAQQNDEGKGRL